MSDLTHAFHWLGAKLSTLWGQIRTVAPKLTADIEAFMTTFEAAALAAVEKQEPLVLSGQEKFTAACAEVLAEVTAAGWKAGATLIQTLVQDAVLTFKAKVGQNLVTPPPQ